MMSRVYMKQRYSKMFPTCRHDYVHVCSCIYIEIVMHITRFIFMRGECTFIYMCMTIFVFNTVYNHCKYMYSYTYMYTQRSV